MLTKEPNRTMLATADHWLVLPEYPPQIAILGVLTQSSAGLTAVLGIPESQQRESRSLDTGLG